MQENKIGEIKKQGKTPEEMASWFRVSVPAMTIRLQDLYPDQMGFS